MTIAQREVLRRKVVKIEEAFLTPNFQGAGSGRWELSRDALIALGVTGGIGA